mmetsp:Transcript_25943/g.86387  ORF Transcript_25943/g.86387 Transcript_25943/m.86387 type:complete len:450 (-) Transcript_25943:544-1893(-)
MPFGERTPLLGTNGDSRKSSDYSWLPKSWACCFCGVLPLMVLLSMLAVRRSAMHAGTPAAHAGPLLKRFAPSESEEPSRDPQTFPRSRAVQSVVEHDWADDAEDDAAAATAVAVRKESLRRTREAQPAGALRSDDWSDDASASRPRPFAVQPAASPTQRSDDWADHGSDSSTDTIGRPPSSSVEHEVPMAWPSHVSRDVDSRPHVEAAVAPLRSAVEPEASAARPSDDWADDDSDASSRVAATRVLQRSAAQALSDQGADQASVSRAMPKKALEVHSEASPSLRGADTPTTATERVHYAALGAELSAHCSLGLDVSSYVCRGMLSTALGAEQSRIQTEIANHLPTWFTCVSIAYQDGSLVVQPTVRIRSRRDQALFGADPQLRLHCTFEATQVSERAVETAVEDSLRRNLRRPSSRDTSRSENGHEVRSECVFMGPQEAPYCPDLNSGY